MTGRRAPVAIRLLQLIKAMEQILTEAVIRLPAPMVVMELFHHQLVPGQVITVVHGSVNENRMYVVT